MSPAMHNAAFKSLGIDAVYLAFDVLPENTGDMVSVIRTLPILGCNLTMPLKNTVIPFLDELDREAEISGSVNTIKNEDGRLIGYTTDGKGYFDSLYDAGFDIMGKNMTILGAGGAAKSIIVKGAMSGVSEMSVFKRKNASYSETEEFIEKVKRETGAKIELLPFEDEDALKEKISESDLLTNATNVGMGEDKNSPVKKEYLHGNLFVSDIIYHPEETTLLKDGKETGCKILNGKDMLYFQGAQSFKIWTGEDMPVGKDIIG